MKWLARFSVFFAKRTLKIMCWLREMCDWNWHPFCPSLMRQRHRQKIIPFSMHCCNFCYRSCGCCRQEKKDENNESGYAEDRRRQRNKKKTDYLNTFKELTVCNERESNNLMVLQSTCCRGFETREDWSVNTTWNRSNGLFTLVDLAEKCRRNGCKVVCSTLAYHWIYTMQIMRKTSRHCRVILLRSV